MWKECGEKKTKLRRYQGTGGNGIFIIVHFLMQDMAMEFSGGAAVPLMKCPHGGWSSNLEFVDGAVDRSPALRERHRGIFNVHQLMLGDGIPSLTSIRGTARPSLNHPACETPG